MSSPDPNQNLDYGERGSVAEYHGAAGREKQEPRTGMEPISLWASVIGGLIFILGGVYLGQNAGGFTGSIYARPNYTPDPRPALAGVEVVVDERPWIEKWMDDGKGVYGTCQGCHQSSGMGVPGQFPPLVDTKWVLGGTERLGMIMVNGINGPLTVKGNVYNGVMPAQAPILTDKQIAQVMTYIRRTWGNEASVVTEEMVAHARDEHGGRTDPWTEAELLAVAEDAMLPGVEVDLQTGEPIGAESGGETAAEETPAE